jgi:hypothetical protein
VTSCLSRELRSIPGITIADTEHIDYEVDIVTLQVHTGTVISGYVISTVVLEPSPTSYLEAIANRTLPKDVLNELVSFYSDDYKFMDHFIRTAGASDLQELCKQVVADLDIKWLEPNRKIWESLHSPGR